MSHFETLLDIGYDYGAEGGQAWDSTVIVYPNFRSVRNQNLSRPIGAWQLGDRVVSATDYQYLQSFLHATRGQVHSFNYKDWNDYCAIDEQLANVGDGTLQITKTYGLLINGWVRSIKKLKPDDVVLKVDDVEQVEDTDYTLDDTSGLITWNAAPDTGAIVTWSGEFYVPVRFDRDVLTAQFLGLEQRNDGSEFRAYQLGALSVVEDPEA
jgi:uncharacterized protein (TIGR02217 family)